MVKLNLGSYSHCVNLYCSSLGGELGCLTVGSHLCLLVVIRGKGRWPFSQISYRNYPWELGLHDFLLG